MEASKSLKKAVLVSMVSAATSIFVTYVGQRLLRRVSADKRFKDKDRSLNYALEDSMDCSDSVAKY